MIDWMNAYTNKLGNPTNLDLNHSTTVREFINLSLSFPICKMKKIIPTYK